MCSDGKLRNSTRQRKLPVLLKFGEKKDLKREDLIGRGYDEFCSEI
jgi:hypothetical protein